MRAYPPPSPGGSPGEYFAGRDRQAQTRAVAAVIDRLLTAGQFDAASCAWLAERERFADAARLLRYEFRENQYQWPDLLLILLDRHCRLNVRAFRLALEFKAVAALKPTARHDQFTTSDLRITARSKNKRRARGAREALAALGSIKWKSATRRERAAFVLGEICRLHWERAE